MSAYPHLLRDLRVVVCFFHRLVRSAIFHRHRDIDNFLLSRLFILFLIFRQFFAWRIYLVVEVGGKTNQVIHHDGESFVFPAHQLASQPRVREKQVNMITKRLMSAS